MSWNTVVLTDLGERLLADMLNGSKLTFTAAAIGSGIVEEDELPGLSNVASPINAPALIAGQRRPTSGNGTEILLQIRNDGLEQAAKMRQVGLFAKTESSEEIFFAVLQEENGEEIPAYKDFSQFEISFSVAIAVSRTNNITVVVSPFVYASKADLDALEKRLPKPISFSVDVGAWTELSEPFVGCKYCAEVTDENTSSTDFPDVYFDTNSIESAAESAIMVVSDVAKIIFYAESIPSVTLSGTYFVRKGVVE